MTFEVLTIRVQKEIFDEISVTDLFLYTNYLSTTYFLITFSLITFVSVIHYPSLYKKFFSVTMTRSL